MAVKIELPNGLGTVEVQGMAEQETLKQILAAMDKRVNGKNKAAQEETEEKKKGSKAAKDLASQLGLSEKAAKDFSVAWAIAAANTIDNLKNLGVTAVNVAAKFMTDYARIAEDPITAGKDLINTAIDVTASFAEGLTSAIPVIGEFLSAAEKAAAELLKVANNAFADQLKKNVDALQTYAKSGVSFSGGMAEAALAATNAGLGIKDFSQGVSKAKHDLNFLGLSGGDAALKLSESMGAATTKIGKSGSVLRDEMFKMGYTYDEQIEVMGSFMANMKAAGKLEMMSKEEIAEGTRNYARDLKIVADFTGQDAKKLAERGRQQQLMLIAQQRLDKDQNVRLGQATQILGRMGPDAERARQALTQMLVNGTTNIQGYTMGPGRKMIETMVANIKSGQEDVYKNAGQAYYKAQQAALKDPTQGAIVNAKLMNATSTAIDGVSSFNEGLFSSGLVTQDQIDKMGKQTDQQASNHDKVSENTAKVYSVSKQLQVSMENMLNTHLDTYAKGLASAFDSAAKTIMKWVNNPEPTKKGFGGSQITEEQARENFIKGGGKKGGGYFYNGMVKQLAGGGDISSGEVAIAGEAGPELISGPSSVLSKASTESLIRALDAMKEKAGHRFGDNGFDEMVGTSKARMAKIKERISGFEGFDVNTLQAELDKRPEMDPIKQAKAAMMEGEDQPTVWPSKEHAAKMDETNALLSELVRHMKQNVTQTARVAMNTN